MTTLNIDTEKSLFYANIVYEIHTVSDKINFFKSKYNTDFESFESQIKTESKEDFEKWDDYIEWKGFQKALIELKSKKTDIENGNIKLA